MFQTRNHEHNLSCLVEADLPPGFPKFTAVPLSVSPTEGETTAIQCKATGNPPPKIRWFRMHSPLEFPNPKMRILPDNSLQVINVTMKSRSRFGCEISNSIGRRVSRAAGLDVLKRKGMYSDFQYMQCKVYFLTFIYLCDKRIQNISLI